MKIVIPEAMIIIIVIGSLVGSWWIYIYKQFSLGLWVGVAQLSLSFFMGSPILSPILLGIGFVHMYLALFHLNKKKRMKA